MRHKWGKCIKQGSSNVDLAGSFCSDSIFTANLALKENRNVLAIPGPINSEQSLGCNELIASGARPILNANDILEELGNRFYKLQNNWIFSSFNNF